MLAEIHLCGAIFKNFNCFSISLTVDHTEGTTNNDFESTTTAEGSTSPEVETTVDPVPGIKFNFDGTDSTAIQNQVGNLLSN